MPSIYVIQVKFIGSAVILWIQYMHIKVIYVDNIQCKEI